MARNLSGWRPSRPDHRDHRFAVPAHVAAALPAFFDLSEAVAPLDKILDQGDLGSCGPNSAAECIAGDSIREGQPKLPSRLFIYYCTRDLQGTVNQDSGVDNRTMLKALAASGWCDESLYPYKDTLAAMKKKPTAACYDQAADRKIAAYQAVSQDLPTMKGCLAALHPFIYGFSVPESFMGDATAKTGIVAMPAKREKIVGGHDLSVWGYTDVDRAGVMPGNKWPANTFKMRNHWYEAASVPWGDGGYCYMPYAFATNATLASDFWAIFASGLVPAPAPTPPAPIPDPAPTPAPVTHVIRITGLDVAIAVDPV